MGERCSCRLTIPITTWAGTVLAARALRDFGPAETAKALKANIVAAIDATACRLGNTRAVCRASYIHPAILAGYERGNLGVFASSDEGHKALNPDERWLLAYLSQVDLVPDFEPTAGSE